MATITETKITSSEVSTMWVTYQIKSLMQQMTGVFAQKSTEQGAKDILNRYQAGNQPFLTRIEKIYENEKAVLPEAFSERDVFNDAPALFDDIFNIMFLRMMTKVTMGFNAVHAALAFRQDVRDYFRDAWNFAQQVFDECTNYLTGQGVLARPPYVTMPKQVEYVEEKRYMSGLRPFRNKRSLNMLELSYIYANIETNIVGMQLMTGFGQVAREKEVREFFLRGKELAKKIISDLSNLILDSDIQAPATWAGKATDSIVPPFSDKLMLFLTNILTSSSMYVNSMGLAFSMRSDLPAELAIIMAGSAKFARDGGKIMIEHKWLEEPPQAEDRNELIRSNQ